MDFVNSIYFLRVPGEKTCKKSSGFFFLMLCFLIVEHVSAQTFPKPNLGDHYYTMKEYHLARIEYERALLKNSKSQPGLIPKIGLSLIRQKKYKKASFYLSQDKSFTSQYLDLYATLKQNQIHKATFLHSKIENNPQIDQKQKFLSRLIAGSIYLEKNQYKNAIAFYEKIKYKSDDTKIVDTADQVLVSLKGYDKLDSKSAILAGIFSSLIPGSGQMYTEHYVDGGVALFFNTMFLGSAIVLYDLETQAGRPHQASIVAGIFGISFYISNILGAYKSAHRYNIYQKRKLYQDIRELYFNDDFIESTSQLKFTERF